MYVSFRPGALVAAVHDPHTDDVAKSYRFEPLAHEHAPDGSTFVELQMTHEPTGQRVITELTRHHDMPDGHWTMSTIRRPKDQRNGVAWDAPANTGALGVSGVRALSQHLKQTYGVRSIDGLRITGTRRKATIDNRYVKVQLTKADVAAVFKREGRGDALQPWHIRKKKGPLKFNEDPIEIVRSAPAPMRDRFNAPMTKSWVDAGDNKPTSQWTVKPFRTMRPERGIEHAHISAPGNRGAVMSYKHNAKTGHTEILNFRAYTFHNDAFKAGQEAMHQGTPMADVDNIIELHRSNVGVIGPAGVRAAARYLKEKVGSKTVGGLRVSGSRMNNENDLPKQAPQARGNLETLPGVKVKRPLGKALFDFKQLSKDPIAVPQTQATRSDFATPKSFAKYDETVGRTLKAWNSAANRKRLDDGLKAGGHEWYHMDPLHKKFQERHGPEEGSRRFNLFMDTIAGTSHNSEFGVNMRRSGALFPFMLHGDPSRKLSREEGLNHLLGPRLGNTAHREMAGSLQAIREGRANISKEPLKIDGFSANLRGNFHPLTADRHVGRQSGHDGETGSPTTYRAIEDATQFHAQHLADRGTLPVAPGRSATAPFQSALWIGDALAGRVKSAPHPALVDFHKELTHTADRIGISHTEALDRFMDGHLHEFGGGAPGLREHVKAPVIAKAPRMKKAIDYDALDDAYEPRPKKGGKGGKGSPVGSRTDQARHQTPAYQALTARVEALKPTGVSSKEFLRGAKHEAEHEDVAPSKVTQAKIAAAHLKDDPHYYTKLARAGIK